MYQVVLSKPSHPMGSIVVAFGHIVQWGGGPPHRVLGLNGPVTPSKAFCALCLLDWAFVGPEGLCGPHDRSGWLSLFWMLILFPGWVGSGSFGHLPPGDCAAFGCFVWAGYCFRSHSSVCWRIDAVNC